MKKNYFKTYVLAVLALITASCGDSKTESVIPTIRVEQVLDGAVEMKLSEIAKNVEYIPLETTDDVLLSTALQLVNAGDKYLLLDRKGNIAALYDKDGKFIRKIGVQGKGPQELEQFNRGIYEEDSDSYMIASYRKAVRFDTEGNYINHFSLEKFSNGYFTYMGDNKYLVCSQKGNPMKNDMEEYIFLANVQGDSLNCIVGNKVKYSNIKTEYNSKGEITSISVRRSPTGSYLIGDKLRVISSETDTIVSLGLDLKPTPTYIIDYGNYKLLPDYSNESKAVSLSNNKITENSNSIFCEFRFPDGSFNYSAKYSEKSKLTYGRAVFNKKNESFLAVDYNKDYEALGIINDLDGESGYPFWPQTIYEGAMFQILDALTFMDYAEISDSPKMKEVAAGLTENSNPVLVVVR